jgi:hypothetical protein
MNFLTAFFIKSIYCSGLFYLVYFLLLRKLSFFRWNRFYLLASLLFSVSLPFIRFSIPAVSPFNKTVAGWIVTMEKNREAILSTDSFSQPVYMYIVFYLYLAGVVIMLVKLFSGLYRIQCYKQSGPIYRIDRINIYHGKGKIQNCSFFSSIFLDPVLVNTKDATKIIQHESAHIYLLHSLDKLFMQLLQAIVWINPFIYLYRKALYDVHEFEVDALITEHCDKEEYTELLLRLSTGSNHLLLNAFSQAPIVRRIQMLFMKRSEHSLTWRYLAGLLVLPVVIMASGIRNHEKPEIKVSGKTIQSVASGPRNLDKPAREISEKTNHFFSRKTIQSAYGQEYDEVTLIFSANKVRATLTAGGRIAYLIGNKQYEEEDIKQFDAKMVNSLRCPCIVISIDEKEKMQGSGKYEAMIKLTK